jgi:hypothetical protein
MRMAIESPAHDAVSTRPVDELAELLAGTR